MNVFNRGSAYSTLSLALSDISLPHPYLIPPFKDRTPPLSTKYPSGQES